MTLDEILNDEALRQREFPVTKNKIFLAHAGVCPLPRRVAEAISDYAAEASRGDQEKFALPQILNRARELAGKLLNCEREEIALVGPTSLGLSLIASGLQFRRGDNVLIYFDDYPSNVYPWMALAEQGIEVRLMNTRELGLIRPKDVAGQIDENTRLVALASCHFMGGYRIDLQAIGSVLRERNILFCVDAIQTLGAFSTTVEHVDMLAADAHKWLLGPCAAGLLYVRRALQDRVNPPLYGWHNVSCPDFISQERISMRKDARKYEAGTHNLIGAVGLVAALELILEIGLERIATELLRKRGLLVPALKAKRYTVLHDAVSPQNASGIVTFHKPGQDMSLLHQRLNDAGIITSLRTARGGARYIRLSPHFYNTDEELHRVLELL